MCVFLLLLSWRVWRGSSKWSNYIRSVCVLYRLISRLLSYTDI